MVLRARARSLIGAPAPRRQGFPPVRCSAPAGRACSPSDGAGTARRSCPSTVQPGARHWPGRPAGGRSCAAARRWPRACAARPASAAAGHPAAVRSAATGCVPRPRPAAGAGTGLAVPTALRSRPDHRRPGAMPSPARPPPARPPAWPDRCQARGTPPRPAAAWLPAPTHAQTFLAPPRSCTRTPRTGPHLAACDVTAASRAVTVSNHRGPIPSARRQKESDPRAATGIKKEPGSRGSQALQAGTRPEDSVVAHVRSRTGWRRSYAAAQVKATLYVMRRIYLILMDQSRCQTASMKSTACFSAIRA